MDPITQGALGAVAAQVAYGKRLPRSAALIGWAAGMAADLDVFIPSGGDPVSGIIFHRHFTHSLIFIPLGGLICASAFIWWRQFKGYRLDVLGAAVIAYATHGVLDAFTSYGTLLLWPFSDRRIAWDWIGIVDPLFTIPLIIGMIWTIVSRRPRAAQVGLLVASAYMCFGGWQHYRAGEAQAALAHARGHTIEHSRVMPAPGALLMWRSIYISNGQLYADGLRVPYWGETLMREGGSAPLATFADLPAEIRARTDTQRIYEVFAWFADGLVTRVEGETNVFGDQRFARDWSGVAAPMWGMDFGATTTDAPMRWRPAQDRGRSGFASELWRTLIYGDPSYRPVAEVVVPATRGSG